MKTSIKYLSILSLSAVIAACGSDGDSNDTTTETPAPVVNDGPQFEFAGGQPAQDFADETASFTNVDSVVPGSPSALAPGEVDDDDFAPAPASIGADIPITYFGPPPTDINPRLIGPLQLLTAGQLDLEAEPTTTVTLPLYLGRLERTGSDIESFYYIVTDTSDAANAEALGLNHAAKLSFADVPPLSEDASMVSEFMASAVRRGFYDRDGVLVVNSGSVDFSPVRSVSSPTDDVTGTNNLLSTLAFVPGAVGTDADDSRGFYSPLVEISNAGGHIYNAPVVATSLPSDFDEDDFCVDGGGVVDTAAHDYLHDSVVSFCPGDDPGEPGTVTLELVNGFSFGRPVLYISTEASAPIAAALEGAVYAPALANVPVGRDDSLFSAIERIFGFTNGPVNDQTVDGSLEVNPQRQGFNGAILGQGGPLNVLGGVPTIATDYSPLWDLNLGEWTQDAIDRGYRSRMTEEFAILGMAERGFLTGPGGSAYGSVGIIINCPIVHRLL